MITEFTGTNRFLSNFYIEPDGTHVEREFQMAKCEDPRERFLFVGLSPSEAKKTGKTIKLRIDWEDIKHETMYECVLHKFRDHSELGDMLLATGEDELVEGNMWHDIVWGRCMCAKHKAMDPDDPVGYGENCLGNILMAVRAQLRAERG